MTDAAQSPLGLSANNNQAADNPVAYSFSDISASSNYFNQNKPAKPPRRSRTYLDSLRKLNKLQNEVNKETDAQIKSVNNIAKQTLNKKADYESLERQQPEMQYLDHCRFINERVLLAEEEDVRLECTPLYIEGTQYRRFLPETVARRSRLCEEEMQEVYLQDETERCLKEAKDIMILRIEEEKLMRENAIEEQ